LVPLPNSMAPSSETALALLINQGRFSFGLVQIAALARGGR
jgi:hypothetical protein